MQAISIAVVVFFAASTYGADYELECHSGATYGTTPTTTWKDCYACVRWTRHYAIAAGTATIHYFAGQMCDDTSEGDFTTTEGLGGDKDWSQVFTQSVPSTCSGVTRWPPATTTTKDPTTTPTTTTTTTKDPTTTAKPATKCGTEWDHITTCSSPINSFADSGCVCCSKKCNSKSCGPSKAPALAPMDTTREDRVTCHSGYAKDGANPKDADGAETFMTECTSCSKKIRQWKGADGATSTAFFYWGNDCNGDNADVDIDPYILQTYSGAIPSSRGLSLYYPVDFGSCGKEVPYTTTTTTSTTSTTTQDPTTTKSTTTPTTTTSAKPICYRPSAGSTCHNSVSYNPTANAEGTCVCCGAKCNSKSFACAYAIPTDPLNPDGGTGGGNGSGSELTASISLVMLCLAKLL